MKFKFTRLAIALSLVATFGFASAQFARAASHTWSGAVNGLWSNAGNWSSGGVPTIGEANITLSFPGSATRTVMTNDIGALTLTSMNFSGSNYVLRGNSAIAFNTTALIQILASGNSNVIESTLNLSNYFVVSVGDNDLLALHTLTGPGTLVKFGEGGLHLRGGANNTLSGGYQVNIGALELQKTGGATAIAGPLTIVGSTNIGQFAVVRLNSSEQIAANVNVVIHPTGLLNMNGFTNTINDLTVMAGTVYNSGLLRVQGDMILSAQDNVFPTPDVSPIIQSDVEFVGAATTITVSNLTAEIQGSIVEYSGTTVINKTGPGTLWLKGGGNNPGAINVLQGGLRAELATSLGTATGNTTVASGATLTLGAGMSTSESLVLSNNSTFGIASGVVHSFGNISIAGEVTVNVPVAGNQFLVNGIISGAGGLKKIGDGELMITGNTTNTFTGASFVAKGRINLNKPANLRSIASVTVTNGAELKLSANDLIDNAATVSVYSSGLFNMTNRNQTIGGLNMGRGNTIDTGTGMLTLQGNVYVGAPYSTSGGSPTIRGFLSLGGGIRRFHAPDTSLLFDCIISDGAGVGGLSLSGGGGTLGFGNFQFIKTNTFNGPITADYAGLFAHNPQSFGTTNAGIIGTNDCEIILFKTNLVVTGESLTSEQLVILYSTGSNTWNGPAILAKTNSILRFNPWAVGDTNTLTVNGSISGPGGLVLGDNKYYAPGMTVRLTQSNSYAGTTTISPGKLIIQNPHALGNSTQGTTITGDGALELQLTNGTTLNEPLTFAQPDSVTNLPPTLVVSGGVSNNWNGPITMMAAPSRISVLNYNGTLAIKTAITGGGSLAKTGLGSLILAGNGANQLSQLIAEHGQLRLAQTGGYALPSGNVTVLGEDYFIIDGIPWSSPAFVQLEKPNQLPPFTTLNLIGPEGGISLNEQNLQIQSLSGAGSLYTSTGTLTFSNAPGEASFFYGRISSEYGNRTNLIKLGDGALFLNGPSFANFNNNDWYLYDSIGLHGTVQMMGGQLDLTNGIIGSLQLASGTITVTRCAPAPNLPGYFQNGLRLGSLSGSGFFGLNDGSWVYIGTDDTSSIFNGAMSGGNPAKLIKTGTGTLTLAQDGLGYTGSALVENGTLLVNAAFNCNVLVQTNSFNAFAFATLGGTGQVKNVTLNGLRARISPGATTNEPSYGRLRVNNFTLASGAGYRCEINGTNAGVNMDQIDAAGTVSLTGGFADFMAFGVGVVSNQYPVIKSPFLIGGTLSGDPEGDTLYPAAGRVMKITYLLAGGNEVTLIEQAGAPPSNIQISGITQQTNGHITLAGTGLIGATYFIEANTNLNTTNWVTIGSVLPNFNGDISFTDTNAPSPQKFYRFRQQ